jgi:hypothetical protein
VLAHTSAIIAVDYFPVLSGSAFQKDPSMVLLAFEIENRDNTGIYIPNILCIYYYGGGQGLLFCFVFTKLFSLTWSDYMDVVFKVM